MCDHILASVIMDGITGRPMPTDNTLQPPSGVINCIFSCYCVCILLCFTQQI